MKTKLFYGNQYVGSFNCDGRKYSKLQYQLFLAKRMFLRCLVVSFLIVTAGWLVTAGIFISKNTIEPEIVYGKEIVEVPIKEIPPVMQRIAQCESGNKHYNKGQVILRSNKDGSVDIGKYQINSIHSKEASRLGLDLTKEKDNEAYAMYLYENQGTEPWYASIKCWSK